MYLWNDKKKHMRAGATKIKISWILNKNIMNIWVFFPCLRVSSDRCFDYTGLHSVTLVGAECWYVIVVYIMYDISSVFHVSQTTFWNATPTEGPTLGIYRFSCFTAFPLLNRSLSKTDYKKGNVSVLRSVLISFQWSYCTIIWKL